MCSSFAERRPDHPIRVCFVIDRLGTAGTELQLSSLIERLDRSKVLPYLCLLKDPLSSKNGIIPQDCPTIRLGVRSFHSPSTLRAAWRFARFLRREEIDIVQVHFPDSTYFAVPIAKLARVPHVVRTRRNLGHWVTARDRWLGRLLNCGTDATLANCDACRQAVITQEGVRPDSVAVIENGVKLWRFADVASVSLSDKGSPTSVGMVANYRPLKGSDVFVKAAKILSESRPNVTFQVAGFGNRGPVLEMTREMGIEDRFQVHDQVDDVPSFLSGLDVAVLPSRTEGLSNSLLEYMAAGRPIVATAVGGTPEVIEDCVHGLLVPAGDAEATARAIDRILRDPSLAARLGAAAKARVWQHNSMETMTRQHESFYSNLVSSGASRTVR